MTDTTATETADTKPPAPPWGDAENFDPARAWALITNLREEVTGLKADKAAAEADRDAARADAEKAQKDATEAVARAEAAEAKTKESERAAWVADALRKHPLPEGLTDEDRDELLTFLTGETPEEVERKAARLAALRGDTKPQKEQEREEEAGGQAPPTNRPTTTLTPGHGGETPAPFDAVAIAAGARNRP